MANLGSMLKTEISRLSRREIRGQIMPLRKIAWTLRREVAALKRRLNESDRRLKGLARISPQTPVGDRRSERPIRFVAKGLRSLRRRLGLSANQLAQLINVSPQSVYNWEQKKAVPRKEQAAAIASIRTLGKRQAIARLESLAPGAKSKGSKRKK